MTDIGITGTRIGATPRQLISLTALFGLIRETSSDSVVLHHGDCVGVDQQACELALEAAFLLHCHPPTNPKLRARIQSDMESRPKDYLLRNRDIVNFSDVLIALPKTIEEELRSGTWATIRYAQRVNHPYIIVRPDGTIIWKAIKTTFDLKEEDHAEKIDRAK